MKKVLLFAIAIFLGSFAFAEVWDPPQIPQEICERFSYQNWQYGSRKGCLTCPVRENGHMVKCETDFSGDCCWLNTPKAPNLDPILGNCYTNAYVLGPNPWSIRCVELMDTYLTGGTGGNGGNGGGNAGNGNNGGTNGGATARVNLGTPGGNGGNGGNGNNGGDKTKVRKPATPAKSVSEKQPVQSSSKKAAK